MADLAIVANFPLCGKPAKFGLGAAACYAVGIKSKYNAGMKKKKPAPIPGAGKLTKALREAMEAECPHLKEGKRGARGMRTLNTLAKESGVRQPVLHRLYHGRNAGTEEKPKFVPFNIAMEDLENLIAFFQIEVKRS